MTPDEQQYQPGLHKLIYHPAHVANIVNSRPVAPLHISVWPTRCCQCNCAFCGFKHDQMQDIADELDAGKLIDVITAMQTMGLKAVEFSGGGEPTLWGGFKQAVDAFYDLGLSLSLITNGYALWEYSRETLEKFDWIRVSIHDEKHFATILETSPVKFQASYIFGENECNADRLKALMLMADREDLRLRVAVEQPATFRDSEEIKYLVRAPHIFTEKRYSSPRGCYMAWIRAAIDWRGNFLVCPSSQYTRESAGKVPPEVMLCHYTKAVEWLVKNPPFDLGFRCSTCVCGHDMNNYIHELKYDRPEDVDFV